MLKRSNYRFLYMPGDGIEVVGGRYNFNVEVSKEFCEFAKKQEIDKERWEEFSTSVIRNCGFKEFDPKTGDHGNICGWDGGLLRFISVPGSSRGGLALSYLLPECPKYVSHNVDTLKQNSALFSIISNYLMKIELLIDFKIDRFKF